MDPSDYMDRSRDEYTPKGMDLCWAHFMPIGDTGRGAIFVLGMPFLRTFYTAYDVKEKKIGIALAKQGSVPPDPKLSAADTPLVAVRPGGDDIGGRMKEITNRPKKT